MPPLARPRPVRERSTDAAQSPAHRPIFSSRRGSAGRGATCSWQGGVRRFAGAGLEQSAQAICDELFTVDGIDFASVDAFLDVADAIVVAKRGSDGFPLRVGDHLPAGRSRQLFDSAATGPSAEYWHSTAADDEMGALIDRAGLRAFAYGPIVHGDHADGAVVIATADLVFARTLVERIPGLVDLTTTPSALLADQLHHYRHAARTQPG